MIIWSKISIHKALASLDMWVQGHVWVDMGFQSTRLSRASTSASSICLSLPPFQSTRLSRASTAWDTLAPYPVHISIHKALASLDVAAASFWKMGMDFNPQGSREPRQLKVYHNHCHSLFQSTRLSRASTLIRQPAGAPLMISIHKALASLDRGNPKSNRHDTNFNPQGSREPRRWKFTVVSAAIYFNPQGSREPRHGAVRV